ncbi:MAG TPA: ABC-F family ATP-binding cassette domain-containing protein [Gaiellaceae bacterium]|nr:ABC-F family ATP-binding cassette domain-containing protein [Gaiellaceae bacterium]
MASPSGTLVAAGIAKSHGAQVVLAGVDLVVPPQARIGLVGPNGAGKSTLLRLLAGLEQPEGGHVRRTPPSLAVGHLPQERDPQPRETLRAYLERRTGVGAAAFRMDALAARLGDEPVLAVEHAEALEEFLARGGADLDTRAVTTLAELGFDVSLDRPLEGLSGGEAARVALASILLSRFDVLCLDEPTNDLDFAGLARLEAFLAGFRGALVVVSHDRTFLDRTVTRVVELDEWTHGAREYAGGWSAYEAERTRQRERAYESWEGYVAERDRVEQQRRQMQEWEQRGYGQGRKKKKGKDVKKTYAKRLERVEAVEKPYEQWELRLGLVPAARSGDVVVRLEGAVAARGTFRLGPLDLELRWGDRVALVGPNGSGKTTLLDVLLGRLEPAAGTRWAGPGVVLGELEQRRETFAGAASLLALFLALSGLVPENARTLLAKFGLGADDVLRPADSLSPGERTRAVLALLAARGVNCLVLDEPTNHLDVEAIEELERALERYEGTVLLVTHDRRFLQAFGATRTIEL